jgi:sugar-phosphatase
MTPPLLFDLDGTLVDSRVVVERQWGVLCARLGLDFPSVLAILHGVRSVDTIRAVAPHVDAEAEAEALDALEEDDTEGLEIVRGADDLLARLPAGSWGIVTSGHRALAQKRLRAVGLPVPAAMVCGDEVANGKPHPEGYLQGARLLGAEPGACVVCEDAPAGIEAAHAAGMAVIGITTTHERAALMAADAVIDDLRAIDDALAALRGE